MPNPPAGGRVRGRSVSPREPSRSTAAWAQSEAIGPRSALRAPALHALPRASRRNGTDRRGTKNSFLQAPHGFVHHRKYAASLDLVGRHFGSAAACRQQLVHGWVNAAFLAGVVVSIETLLALPSSAPRRHHALERLRGRHAIAERLEHDRAGFAGDIEPDLVDERDRTDRKPELGERPIHRLDRDAFVQQEPRFI